MPAALCESPGRSAHEFTYHMVFHENKIIFWRLQQVIGGQVSRIRFVAISMVKGIFFMIQGLACFLSI
jgi:hypothetical protein